MSTTISVSDFRTGVLTMLEEIFEKVQGYTLDPGDSLFETLAGISAAEASIPVSRQSASLAAQVNHTRFYLDALLAGPDAGPVDWESSWAITSVTDDEWNSLIDRLHTTYQQVRRFVETFENWDVRFIGGAIALCTHTSYHLGEIRQGIGVLRTHATE